MCGCTTGCNECNITSLTKGEKGDKGNTGAAGPGGIYFQAFGEFEVSSVQVNKTYVIVANGDYVLQFDGHYSKVTSTELTSYLMKNGVYQNTNTNKSHRDTTPAGVDSITYTHNAKLTGLVIGDVVGFGFVCGGTVGSMVNSSITILKLT